MYVRGSCSLLCYPRSSEPRLISDQKPAFSDDWTKPDSFLLESTSRQNGQTYPSSKHPPSESEDPAASFTLVNCMKAKSSPDSAGTPAAYSCLIPPMMGRPGPSRRKLPMQPRRRNGLGMLPALEQAYNWKKANMPVDLSFPVTTRFR